MLLKYLKDKRVRVYLNSPEILEGKISELDAIGILLITRDGEKLIVPYTSIKYIEIIQQKLNYFNR